ncbi:MAG TPA: hypothetical protein VGB55_13355, partial [Tepidisphaeraceae bacterium]
TPTDFKVSLENDGALSMTWKCPNGGRGGTMYQIYRRIGAAGEFRYIGGSGSRKFCDPTVPAGASQVTYMIQGMRPTAIGQWGQFNVNFGTSGGVTSTAVSESKVTAMPKMAA